MWSRFFFSSEAKSLSPLCQEYFLTSRMPSTDTDAPLPVPCMVTNCPNCVTPGSAFVMYKRGMNCVRIPHTHTHQVHTTRLFRRRRPTRPFSLFFSVTPSSRRFLPTLFFFFFFSSPPPTGRLRSERVLCPLGLQHISGVHYSVSPLRRSCCTFVFCGKTPASALARPH